MAAGSDSIWAIDMGNCALKALRLRLGENGVEVIGFDTIEHGRILSASDVKTQERAELIAAALHRFVQGNDLGKDGVVISVPSQCSFARLIKLPPVEPKRVPEIIRFEAVQQIPFDINEVEWDWQIMQRPDSPDMEVGIFAVNNEVINEILECFAREHMKVTNVQMAPMALYNYVHYDRAELADSEKKAVIVMNVGSESTDMVICTNSTVWQRCIPLGGNSFTTAISEAFKLNFAKAEKLKCTAPMSKYAKQIFQAMKPVFTDFAAEVQRSVGYYTSTHRDMKFVRVIGLGGGMKLQGLTKYLQQQLQVPVVRPDSFEKLILGSNVSTARFTESVADYGVVYGLGLQGLGLGKIETNLLPKKIARRMAWARKSIGFTAAAIVLLIVVMMCLARASLDRSKYSSNKGYREKNQVLITRADEAVKNLQNEQSRKPKYSTAIDKEFMIFKKRSVVPQLQEILVSCLPNKDNTPQESELYEAFAQGDVQKVMTVSRKERKQLFVTSISVRYARDVSIEPFARPRRRQKSTDEYEGMPGMMGPGGYMMPGMMGPGMMDPGMMWPGGARPGGLTGRSKGQSRDPVDMPQRTVRPGQRGRGRTEDKSKEGFIVTIEGYCPYEKIYELLDPVGVDNNDRSKWGVVTRLMHLKDLFPNCPFELFEKHAPENFQTKTGEVEYGDNDTPDGVGIPRDVKSLTRDSRSAPAGMTFGGRGGISEKSKILIDPMTEEVICKIEAKDEQGRTIRDDYDEPVYNINDRWFTIRAKFLWKNPDAKKDENKGDEEEGKRGERKR
ncbi:MAG: pilus assembly protein PilM [Planctomycetota bacterium]